MGGAAGGARGARGGVRAAAPAGTDRGRAVQVDGVKTRVESTIGFSA